MNGRVVWYALCLFNLVAWLVTHNVESCIGMWACLVIATCRSEA